MELNIKQTIAVLVMVILAVSCLIPIINETVRQHDADPLTVPIGAHAVDDLDGWTMDVRKASTGFRVSSSMYDGTVTRTGVILSSSAVSVWTDTNRIYTMIGGTVTAGTTLSAIVEDGVMTVNDTPAVLGGIVYVPDEFGALGSYAGQTHGLPMAGIGSYAGVTVGSIADELTGNSSDYVLDVSVTEDGDRYGVEYVPGEYEAPVQVPPRQQAQVKPGLDLDVIEDPEIFEKEEFGTVEKGEITIVPSKGGMLEDIDIGGTISTGPEKVPTADIQATVNATSGTTGDCTWELVDTTLYIRGPGKTENLSTTRAPPWGRDITYAVVEEGVTFLGYAFFYHCYNLTGVELANSVAEFGRFMFVGDKLLESVTLPSSLKTLPESAFNGCTGLKEINWGASIKTINVNALANCPSLEELTIPSTVTSIATQDGMHFYDADGVELTTPVPGYYRAGEPSNLYIAQEVVGNYSGWIYAVGMDLTDVGDSETVHLPYTVEYDGKEYPVRSLESGAISGSSVRYVVIPQTVGSVSPTAITGSGVKEILNLSATEVTASHGEVRTSVPALAVIAEPVTAKGFGATASMLWIIPLMLVAGAVISIVRGFARARYD